MPRGRPKKEEEISQSEVFDVFEFTRQLYNTIYTPGLVNDRMKDATLNPLSETEANINSALLKPKENEKTLREIGQYFEITNMIYRRLVHYIGDMLAFDLTFTCKNAEPEDLKSKAYQKDLNIVHDFLYRFDYKSEFKKVMRQITRQDAFFCAFRNDDDKYMLQELPIDYCLITGRFPYGLLYDWNMYWMIQPGVDIDMYPASMKRMYRQVFGSGTDKKYNPSAAIDKRNGQYTYWTQTSPDDGYWAFKFTQEFATQLPFFSGMYPDLVLAPLMRTLQKNKSMISASKIIMGSVPLLDNQKSGQIRDALAVSSDTIGKFLGLVKSAMGETIKVGAMPLSDIKGIDFNVGTNDLYADYTKMAAGSSGINSRLIFTHNDKQTSEETRNSISVDSYMLTALYPMFNDFLNYYVNKKTKKFKFDFRLEGTEFDIDRASRFDRSMKLAEKGIFLPDKIAASMGMTKLEMSKMMESAQAEKWQDKFMVMISMYQNGGEGGRPTAEDSGKPLSDSGVATRDSASNIDKNLGKI